MNTHLFLFVDRQVISRTGRNETNYGHAETHEVCMYTSIARCVGRCSSHRNAASCFAGVFDAGGVYINYTPLPPSGSCGPATSDFETRRFESASAFCCFPCRLSLLRALANKVTFGYSRWHPSLPGSLGSLRGRCSWRRE